MDSYSSKSLINVAGLPVIACASALLEHGVIDVRGTDAERGWS